MAARRDKETHHTADDPGTLEEALAVGYIVVDAAQILHLIVHSHAIAGQKSQRDVADEPNDDGRDAAHGAW